MKRSAVAVNGWVCVSPSPRARRTCPLAITGSYPPVAGSYNLTPNEGVSEEGWFPVAPGGYQLTVTNVTALGQKTAGQSVAFEVKREVR